MQHEMRSAALQVSAGAGDGGSSFTLCQFPPGNLYQAGDGGSSFTLCQFPPGNLYQAGDGGSSFNLCQFPPGNLYLISNDLAQRPIRLSQRLQRWRIRLRCVVLRRSAHGKSVSMRHRAACSSAAEASASRVVVPGCPTEFAVKRVGVMIVKQYAGRHIARGAAPGLCT
jgi:hypothetical protein